MKESHGLMAVWRYLVLSVLLALGGGWCFADDIEIIVGGKKYESFQEYLDVRRNARVVKSENAPADRKLWDESFRREQQSSILTGGRYFIHPKDVERYLTRKGLINQQFQNDNSGGYDPFIDSYQRISRFGFNTGVAMVVQDFWKKTDEAVNYKRLMAKDLEKTLVSSFGQSDYEGPILIISHQKKLRIMTLQRVDMEEAANAPN